MNGDDDPTGGDASASRTVHPSRGPRILVIQHEPGTHAARFGQWMTVAGAELVTVRPDLGEPIPPAADYDSFVVLGGAAGPHDDERCPWLPQVRRMLAESAAGSQPSFNICLGGELLAVAAGGNCSHRDHPQVGAFVVENTAQAADDPVFSAAPPEFPTVLWHEEQIDLPPEATLLVTGTDAPVQAFRCGEMAWGTQFHPEANPGLAAHWATMTEKQQPLRDYAATSTQQVIGDVAAIQREMDASQRPIAQAFVKVAGECMR